MKRSWTLARTIGGGFVAVCLTGCVLVDPTDPYRPVPARQNPVAAARARFDTRQPVLPSPLTLKACIALARENNPDVGQAGWNVAIAGAEHAIAAGQRWPSLSVVGGYDHNLDNQRLIAPRSTTDPGVFTRKVTSGELVLTMPIFTGGRITSEIQAAQLLREAADHRLTRTREELIFNVSSVFYGMLAQRHVISSIDFSNKALEEHRQRVTDLVEVQKAARVDLLRTQVRLADLKQQRVRENNVLAILQRVLINLLGVNDPSGQLEIEGELTFEPVQADLPASLDLAFARRADYLAARAEVEAQARRVDAARAVRWPEVSLRGSYGIRHATDPAGQPRTTSTSDGKTSTTTPPEGDTTEDVGFFGVTAELPLFEGGRIMARIRKERSALGAAQERLRKLELQIRLDVQTAILDIDAARERVVATQEAITQARESLRIEREKYDLGRSSQTDVLDAQSALVDAETNYYRALADYNTSRAELALAVGDE